MKWSVSGQRLARGGVMDQPKLEPGVYQHFKGNLYEVIGVARKVDTTECFVIYRPLYGDMQLVARPFDEFAGTVTRDGRPEPRFQHIDASNAACQCHDARQGCGSG